MGAALISNAMLASKKWDEAWDKTALHDDKWMEKLIDTATLPVRKGQISPMTYELLAIGVDAAATYLYSPGVKRHIAKAIDLGATPEEVIEALQVVAALGTHLVTLAAPILLEETIKGGLSKPAPEGN